MPSRFLPRANSNRILLAKFCQKCTREGELELLARLFFNLLNSVFCVVICFEYHSIIILYYDFRGICAIHPKVALFLTFTYFWMHTCTRVCARRRKQCVTPAVCVRGRGALLILKTRECERTAETFFLRN